MKYKINSTMRYLTTLVLLLINLWASGQDKNIIKIGDTLKNYEVTILRTGERTTIANLAKGRRIIIDFWGRRCIPCVNKLPLLDSLQKEFGDEVLFLAMSPEQDNKSINDVLAFIESKPILKKLDLAFVIDTAHAVYNDLGRPELLDTWCDGKRIVRQRPGAGSHMTRSDIVAFIKATQGGEHRLPDK